MSILAFLLLAILFISSAFSAATIDYDCYVFAISWVSKCIA